MSQRYGENCGLQLSLRRQRHQIPSESTCFNEIIPEDRNHAYNVHHSRECIQIFFIFMGPCIVNQKWIIVHQDATVVILLYICRQLYMFRVLTPIIMNSYSCNYSFWHWPTAMNKIMVIVKIVV